MCLRRVALHARKCALCQLGVDGGLLALGKLRSTTGAARVPGADVHNLRRDPRLRQRVVALGLAQRVVIDPCVCVVSAPDLHEFMLHGRSLPGSEPGLSRAWASDR